MQNDKITTLAAEIDATAADIARKRAAEARLAGERQKLDAANYAAVSAHATAVRALSEVRAKHASGSADDGALTAARAACASAEQAVADANRHAPELAEIVSAERVLTEQIDALSLRVADLRSQHANAVKDAQVAAMLAELPKRIDAYTESAAATIHALSRAVALSQHLHAIGSLPNPGMQSVLSTQLGMFEGRTGPNGGDLIAAERLRLAAGQLAP